MGKVGSRVVGTSPCASFSARLIAEPSKGGLQNGHSSTRAHRQPSVPGLICIFWDPISFPASWLSWLLQPSNPSAAGHFHLHSPKRALSPLLHPDNFHQLLVCLTIESWSLAIGTKLSCLESTNAYLQAEENYSRNLKNILKYMRKAEWFLWRWESFWQSLTSHPREEAGCFSGLPALTAGGLFPPWAAQRPLGARVVSGWCSFATQTGATQHFRISWVSAKFCVYLLFIVLVN